MINCFADIKNLTSPEIDELIGELKKEKEKRERLEYEKALAKFFDALEELYSNFPNRYCFDSTTWEDLHEDCDWNF